MIARVYCWLLLLWRRYRSKHEDPHDLVWLSRLTAEVVAVRKRNRQARAERRPRLRRGGVS